MPSDLYPLAEVDLESAIESMALRERGGVLDIIMADEMRLHGLDIEKIVQFFGYDPYLARDTRCRVDAAERPMPMLT